MNKMIDTKDVILALKKVKKDKNLSLDKIVTLMEENGEFVSKTTLSRVFAKGSENQTFRYEATLRPIANALLDIENYEEYDDPETFAFKSLLQLKMRVIDENSKKISELEKQLEDVATKEKLKYNDKLEKHDAQHQKSIDFLKKQIELKDHRITQLLDANDRLSITNNRMLNQILDCPLKDQGCK